MKSDNQGDMGSSNTVELNIFADGQQLDIHNTPDPFVIQLDKVIPTLYLTASFNQCCVYTEAFVFIFWRSA